MQLPRKLFELRSCSYPIYLVGGPVRDFLRKRPIKDFDFLIEGSAETFALARKKLLEVFPPAPGSFKEFPDFLTSCWQTLSLRIDCARPRGERYPYPGSLPKTEPTPSIFEDLHRRDFSINAMALGVSKNNWTQLMDPYEGARDLKSQRLRVLHKKSFEDDPTRLLRAIRFAARFGFSLDDVTRELFKEALEGNFLSKVSWERKRDELLKAFSENKWQSVLNRFVESGFFRDLFPRKIPKSFPLLKSNSTFSRLLTLYGGYLIKEHCKPETLWSKLSWPQKNFSQALEDIEMLSCYIWKHSRLINPLTQEALKKIAPYLFRVFSRSNPMLIAGEDLIGLNIPPLERGRLQEILNSRILKAEIATRREALEWLKSHRGS